MGIFSELANKGQFVKTRQDNLKAVKAGLKKANEKGSKVFQCFDCLASFNGTTIAMSHADSESAIFDYGEQTLVEVVEADGWALSDITPVFRPTTSESRDKFLSSGQQLGQGGEIIALLTFRRSAERQALPKKETEQTQSDRAETLKGSPSLAMVKGMVRAYADRHGGVKADALLRRVAGTGSIAMVPEYKYAEIIAECQK